MTVLKGKLFSIKFLRFRVLYHSKYEYLTQNFAFTLIYRLITIWSVDYFLSVRFGPATISYQSKTNTVIFYCFVHGTLLWCQDLVTSATHYWHADGWRGLGRGNVLLWNCKASEKERNLNGIRRLTIPNEKDGESLRAAVCFRWWDLKEPRKVKKLIGTY